MSYGELMRRIDAVMTGLIQERDQLKLELAVANADRHRLQGLLNATARGQEQFKPCGPTCQICNP